jgi:peptidoglycan/LPS O-acetylase OafA/YrhL
VLVVQSFVLVLANSGVRGAMPVAGWVATVAFFWALFVLLLVRSRWLAPFAVRPMVVVGAASYSLYLLHQAIGVSFITLFERSTGLDGRPTALVALGVAVGLTAASVLVYRRWELPAKRRLLMWRSQRSVASAPAVR